MKDVSRREFLKTLCLGITVAALQNLPMTTAFADSAISKTKIISKSDRENLVATVARTVQVSYKIDKNTIIEVTRFTLKKMVQVNLSIRKPKKRKKAN